MTARTPQVTHVQLDTDESTDGDVVQVWFDRPLTGDELRELREHIQRRFNGRAKR